MEMSPLALPALPLPLPLAWAWMNSTDWTNNAGGATAGVVNPALVRLQHLHEEPHYRARGVELAAFPALG